MNMSSMIQVRNVPEDVHRKLKSRAALEGMSLSDYLLAELTRFAETPTPAELKKRLACRSPVNPPETPTRAVRRERDRLDRS